jgi:membrane protein DedA with SNARE-associated domain/uncharacterized membrane protein YhaH (DUF805 family)
MAMESSIFPVPSEVVIPPAAILASSSGKMSFWGVVLAGTFGSWLGSAITYWVARFVGLPVIERWGKFIFVPPEKLARAERIVHRYEGGGIFFARLLPVVRHIVSIPAGIIRMGFGKFSVMTIVGAGIWCIVLAKIGGHVGDKLRAEGSDPLDPVALVTAVKHESHLIILGLLFLLSELYVLAMWITAPQHEIAPKKVLFSFDGRIRRKTFWIVVYLLPFFWVIASLPLEFARAFGDSIGSWYIPVATVVTSGGFCFCALISFAVQVKRWHDLDKSGWMVLINLIPVIGGLLSLVILGIRRGSTGPNRFGDEPLPKNG